jgi:type VI secretion system protein ImpK
MFPADLDASFVVQNFYNFYEQLLVEKKRILAGFVPSDIALDCTEEQKKQKIVQYMSVQIADILEEQSLSISHTGGEFAVSYYQEAQYIMAALADEIFLNLDWFGRDLWDTCLIENRLFKSQIAGQKFFENLDKFIEERDPLIIDLGAVYYLALSLGFRGKYQGIDDHGVIQTYKKKLFLFVMRREPQLFQGKSLMFPDSYDYTLDQGMAQKLSNPRMWYTALVGLILFMSVVGSLLWYDAIGPLNKVIQSIISNGASINQKWGG